jgi:hypothetical protein
VLVDLEVEVAAGAGGVAGFTDGADRLPLPDPLAAGDWGRHGQVSVEVAAALGFAADQQVVAVEDGVVAALEHAAVADRDQAGATGSGDVEAFVDAAATAGGVEFADCAADAVRSLDREDVAEIGSAALRAGDAGGDGGGECREQQDNEKSGAPQWCSMTRSTMLYSFASSALMK